MTTELTTGGTEVSAKLLAIRQKLGSAFQVVKPEESLSDGVGQSYGVIHYRGKVWSLNYRGQTHAFTRADDGTQASYLDVIILRAASNKSKSFYEGFDQDAAGKRPICASVDGVKPDADVAKPESKACAICPREAWGTDAKTGKRVKDCSDYKRVAILLLPSVSARMLGSPLLEPVFLRIPAASLKPLADYGEKLEKLGIPFFGLITRITFDPTKAHPQFVFEEVQALTDAEGPVVLPLRDDPLTKRIIGLDVVRPALAAPERIETGLTNVVPIRQPEPSRTPPPVQIAVPEKAPVAQPMFIEAKVTPEHTTPWLEVGGIQPIEAAPAPVITATVSEPEEADAALDAHLSKLFPVSSL